MIDEQYGEDHRCLLDRQLNQIVTPKRRSTPTVTRWKTGQPSGNLGSDIGEGGKILLVLLVGPQSGTFCASPSQQGPMIGPETRGPEPSSLCLQRRSRGSLLSASVLWWW
ncbi:hypothetical protein DPEC_G00043130 [Dallia pectoralis]|uniref:Uncharacterized protein n=1 Tax=Dallia pectoralis TaxID=75939 RepID=A0ACC2H9I8_DALPE|nr:hypothetical protein DPEC_G00043130 [Dallia pectoralis]